MARAANGQNQRWAAVVFEDLAELQDMVRQQIDMEDIASHLGRIAAAVRTKLYPIRSDEGRLSLASTNRGRRRRSGASFFLS
jgi:hypothetical protein